MMNESSVEILFEEASPSFNVLVKRPPRVTYFPTENLLHWTVIASLQVWFFHCLKVLKRQNIGILVTILPPSSGKVHKSCKGLNKWFLKEKNKEGEREHRGKEKRKEEEEEKQASLFLICTTPPHPAVGWAASIVLPTIWKSGYGSPSECSWQNKLLAAHQIHHIHSNKNKASSNSCIYRLYLLQALIEERL